MPAFPIYMDIKDKKCVVVGGGKVAARKIEILVQFSNNIIVVSPEIRDTIADLKDKKVLRYIEGTASEEILEGSFLIIAATSNKEENERVYQYAFKHNILINIVDNPEKCSFIFPSIVKRDDLVIGISTSGGFPSLSKRIRKMIEAVVPESLGKTLDILSRNRKHIIDEINNSHLKEEAMDKTLDLVLSEKNKQNENELLIKIEKIIGEVKNEKSS